MEARAGIEPACADLQSVGRATFHTRRTSVGTAKGAEMLGLRGCRYGALLLDTCWTPMRCAAQVLPSLR